jgi:hypothetical protein
LTLAICLPSLEAFQIYYNHNRFHASLEIDTSEQVSGESKTRQANQECYRWQSLCRGLFRLADDSLTTNSRSTRCFGNPQAINIGHTIGQSVQYTQYYIFKTDGYGYQRSAIASDKFMA